MSKVVDKKIINKLLQENKKGVWTKKEIDALREMKMAGIFPATITKNKEIMNEFFPGRSEIGVSTQYGRIKCE